LSIGNIHKKIRVYVVRVAILSLKIVYPWVINANMLIGDIGLYIILYGSD